MSLKWDAKDPDEVLDYLLNWLDRLGEDTIQSSAWAIESPPAPDLTIDSDVFTDTAATVWLSGGESGVTYKLVNTVVTAGGRTMQESVMLKVKTV